MLNTCKICGAEYEHPAVECDRAFADAIGGQAGETCDDCTIVIICGTPAEIEALLARHGLQL
jgi:hypothetical protein